MSQNEQGVRGPAWIATGKDVLALSRDGVLVLLFLMLLVMPGVIGDRLSRAGFEEGSLMGFKWKNKAQDYGAEVIRLKQGLEAANRQVILQSVQLRNTSAELARLRATASSPQQAADLDRLGKANQRVAQESIATSTRLSDQLRASQPVVLDARETLGAATPWAVVMGADPTLAEAQVESRRAVLRGLPNVGIYLRQGYFRTVALAPTKAAADKLLPNARVRTRDAYVVRFDRWCAKREAVEGYSRCLGQ